MKWRQSRARNQGEPVEETTPAPIATPEPAAAEALSAPPPTATVTAANRNDSLFSALLLELKRLDHLLEQAIVAAQSLYETRAGNDPFQGLHITDSEVEQLLSREPLAPFLSTTAEADPPDNLAEESRLDWLARVYPLTPFDRAVILLALAPELDLRYERLYAYLQDDVTRRRPSVDLALNLLSRSAEAKLAQRQHFAPEAPLLRQRLIHLLSDPQQPQAPLLAHSLKLDEQIIHLLLGQDSLDSRLAPFCQVEDTPVSLAALPLAAEIQRALPALVSQARAEGRSLRLYFHGPQGCGKRQTAAALAAALNLRLLRVDLAGALAADSDFAELLERAAREARFRDLLLYLDDVQVLRGDAQALAHRQLLEMLTEEDGVILLAGTQPWVATGRGSAGVLTVPFTLPDFAQRQSAWQAQLARQGVPLASPDLDLLAGRFQLTPAQIADAVATACHHSRWRAAAAPQPAAEPPSPQLSELFAAARIQAGHHLDALACKLNPLYGWDDIVLPPEALGQLRALCQRVAHRQRVLEDWGFGLKLSLGKGISVLFCGPSGTGKTMAAEIIANELGLDLYRIDLSTVISKYIGETEKNLERIFTAAENANAILFFDEADALFGKRSEVRDSHDRYANLEIAYLLQKMEQYQGVAILATNLRQNLDDAFIRRLQFIVEFPFPDEYRRYQIWQIHFPAAAPRESQIDFAFLARQFQISGGNIKNIVLSAAFLGAANGGQIKMEYLLQATQQEYQKMGQWLSASDLGRYSGVMQ